MKRFDVAGYFILSNIFILGFTTVRRNSIKEDINKTNSDIMYIIMYKYMNEYKLKSNHSAGTGIRTVWSTL